MKTSCGLLRGRVDSNLERQKVTQTHLYSLEQGTIREDQETSNKPFSLRSLFSPIAPTSKGFHCSVSRKSGPGMGATVCTSRTSIRTPCCAFPHWAIGCTPRPGWQRRPVGERFSYNSLFPWRWLFRPKSRPCWSAPPLLFMGASRSRWGCQISCGVSPAGPRIYTGYC